MSRWTLAQESPGNIEAVATVLACIAGTRGQKFAMATPMAAGAGTVVARAARGVLGAVGPVFARVLRARRHLVPAIGSSETGMAEASHGTRGRGGARLQDALTGEAHPSISAGPIVAARGTSSQISQNRPVVNYKKWLKILLDSFQRNLWIETA